jgi:hypothetical protein
MTQDELKQLLSYNPNTGVFVWVRSLNNRAPVGAVAGCVNPLGYRQIRINGVIYLTHRLAWFYTHGEWPDSIDHINHKPGDNRLVNLRSVTHQENHRNQSRHKSNTSGYTGVYWSKQKGKWQARIKVDYKYIHIGFYDDINDAAAARREAEIKHNFHTNHGVKHHG